MYDNFKEVSEDEFLAHFGVPGMKWGKRKAQQAKDYVKKNPKKVATAAGIGAAIAVGSSYLTRKAVLKKVRIQDVNRAHTKLKQGLDIMDAIVKDLKLSGDAETRFRWANIHQINYYNSDFDR